MASNNVEAAPAPVQRPPTEPHSNPRRDQRSNRGDLRRGLVRGPQEFHGTPDRQDRPQQDRSRGGQRRMGRRANNESGRRGQPASQVANGSIQPAPVLDPPLGLGGGGTFGGRLTKDATNAEGEVLTQRQDSNGEEEEEEGEVCFICASPVVYHSIAPCNHRTCHICALRLRALYKTRACAHCRTEADHVIFTTEANKRYEDFVDADFHETDDGLGIKYSEKEAHSDTLLLLRFNCPDSSCDVAAWGWPNLHRHVKTMHRRVMCDLCTRNKKVFTHEHELFTVAQLRSHEKYGDDNPGAVDQSGFKGHPECGFCKERFYGDDELYAHCRDNHEKCHMCDRRNSSRQQQYYEDYDSLELHFRHDHYLCSDQECLDKKFVVFESELDLKAHQLEMHSNDLSKDVRKDARRVNISTFDYRTPHQPTRPGRRERGVVPRGRDPNTEPLPQSTAQPLRRDEIAFQRQLAIHSAQSVTSRTFGGQLTPSDPPAPRRNNRVPEPATVIINHNPDRRSELSPPTPPTEPQSSVPPTSETTQEQARRLQHNSVTNRASTLLQNDASKLSTFRSVVSSYRTSQLSASQLLDAFFGLFDCPPNELGKLIKELAELYEVDGKREALLKAWNDWRAINENYPVLPGSSTAAPPPGGTSITSTRSGGYHVLKLKSSTAQSSRSAVSKQGSWGNAARSNPFPTMPQPPAASSVNRAGAGRVGLTPWVNTSTASSSPSSSSRLPSSTRSPASHSSSISVITDAFPALPAAARPNTLIAGLTKGTVRWDDVRNGSPGVNNAWGSSSSSSWGQGTSRPPAALPPPPGGGGGGGGARYEEQEEWDGNWKKKAGKGKKEVLYKFG